MRSKAGVLAAAVLLQLLVTGCASKPSLYYFGDYSTTLYAWEKNRDQGSLDDHKAVLEDIIKQSEERGLPVPPGIRAELGYLYLKVGEREAASALFTAEAEQYPESAVLMERLSAAAEESRE